MSAYLFDFDGTLVDSMPVYGATILRVLDENGVEYPEDIIKIVTPLGLAGTADYFIRDLGLSLPREELIATMTSYMIEAYTYRVPAKKNVEQVLKALRGRGDSLNVLTASPHATLDPCLKRLGLYDLFDHVWSCEDFGTTKADTAIYHMAAERIGVPVDEVIFLDDNYNADLTAKRAGTRVFGVFDESSADAEEAIRGISERYIRDFAELL